MYCKVPAGTSVTYWKWAQVCVWEYAHAHVSKCLVTSVLLKPLHYMTILVSYRQRRDRAGLESKLREKKRDRKTEWDLEGAPFTFWMRETDIKPQWRAPLAPGWPSPTSSQLNPRLTCHCISAVQRGAHQQRKHQPNNDSEVEQHNTVHHETYEISSTRGVNKCRLCADTCGPVSLPQSSAQCRPTS